MNSEFKFRKPLNKVRDAHKKISITAYYQINEINFFSSIKIFINVLKRFNKGSNFSLNLIILLINVG